MATVIPLAVLTFATLLAFVNAWPNRLVFDDKGFAGPGREPVLDSVLYIFTHDVWAWMGSTFGLYRPLLLLQLSAETKVFGAWLQGYHLSNIFQHLIVTLLLYGFLQFLLRSTGGQTSQSRLSALLAALVFAVHPIHAEVVNSVFNRSDMMVAALALCGFWWLLHFLERHPARAWSGLAITYFLAMLCKENALVIPGLAVILILMIKPGNFAIRVRKSLPVLWLLLPLALYVFMRANALEDPEMTIPGSAAPEMATAGLAAPERVHITQVAEGSALSQMLDDMALPNSKNFMYASASVGTAFRLIAWPYPLRLIYGGFSPDERRLYAGLNLVLFGAALILVGRKRFVLPACLAFFYLAMLPASRFFPTTVSSGSHFADRYAYLPSIGLAILLAFLLRHVARRVASRTLVRICLPVLLLLTGLTWDRNADWRSEVALFGVEYERGKPTDNTLRWLTAAHLDARNFARVVKICDENPAEQEEYADSTYTHACATAYEHQHRYEEAERAHLYAIAIKRTRAGAGMSLGRFYLRRARPLDAEKYFKSAIDWTYDPAEKALRMAEMLLALNPRSKEQAIIAKGYIEQALHHRPGWNKAEVMLKALEKALNSAQNALPDLTTPPSPQGTANNTLPREPGSE